MKACRIDVKNFRGIKTATILLPKHGVLIGDNNTGKTTLLEALDLVLGPDRLNRQPPIDEHDFFRGEYSPKPPAPPVEGVVDAGNEEAVLLDAPKIEIEVTVADLTEEQKAKFAESVLNLLIVWRDIFSTHISSTGSNQALAAASKFEVLRA